MSSRGVIDLRPSARGRKPPAGQTSLFSPRSGGEKRPLPLRARKRRKRALIALFALALFAGSAYGIHRLSYLPQFTIQTVSVSGAQTLSEALIVNDAETVLDDGSYPFISNRNIFAYPREKLEQKLVADFPRIAKVYASRPTVLSTFLDINVTERSLYALWCSQDLCYEMDESGFIFAEAATTTRSQYTFSGGVPTSTGSTPSTGSGQAGSPQAIPIGQTFASTHLPSLVALLSALGQSGFSPAGVEVESDTDFVVPLSGGYFLKASFGTSPSTLVRNLQLVLASDALKDKTGGLEYVDLRFGDRIYYKLEGREQTGP